MNINQLKASRCKFPKLPNTLFGNQRTKARVINKTSDIAIFINEPTTHYKETKQISLAEGNSIF